MIKKFLTLVLSISGIAAYAQKAVVITGKLDKAADGKKALLYEPYSGESDTCIVKNHQFKFSMAMPKGGSIYIIQIGNAQDSLMNIFYLEEGNMQIKGKDFNDAKYTGSPWVAEWQEIDRKINPAFADGKRDEDLEALYHKAMEVGDEDKADIYLKEATERSVVRDTFFKEWIKKHSNSGVTGYLLTCYIQGKKERDSILGTLGEHAVNSRIMQRYLHPGKVDPSPMSLKIGDDGADVPGVPHNLKVGEAAPAFTIPDVDGKVISLADFKGKYLFIDFWASWCAPCVAQVPYLKSMHEKYKSTQFEMLGISLDSKRDGWLHGIEKHQLSWINVSSLKGWSEPAAVAYGIAAIPQNVLIGPDGKVIAKNLFDAELDKKMAEIFGTTTKNSAASK
ncbi:redoxin domain-containing protein [Chitinophaga sp. Hz27]|uniref:redoxin domain-containing protein n=1 Tax=Chitinophaga sp. Hz27 TaxID=3347169 RepID=UPI0035E34720